MARKELNDEQIVENYFRTASEMSARGTLRVANAILSVRFPAAAPPADKPKRGRPPKRVPMVGAEAKITAAD